MDGDSARSGPIPPASDPIPATPIRHGAASFGERIVALIEVLVCSDYLTQFVLGATFASAGFRPQLADGSLNFGFVVSLSLIDTVLLIGLMVIFLRAHGEHPRDVFVGKRPAREEFHLGVSLTFVAFAIAVVVLLVIHAAAPWLRTVERNPMQDMLRTPGKAAVFAVVLVVAGGIREELQRAFVLHRFEQWLGGSVVGLVVASIGFGLGHAVQGADAVVATATLGAFWGLVYLRRRSVLAPIVSHAGFDILEVIQFLAFGR